jgi:hypothetical protein
VRATPLRAVVVPACALLLGACSADEAGTAGPTGTASSPADESESTSPSSSSPAPSETSEPSETDADADAAIGDVQEWLEAAQSGDTDAMADLTGSFSLRNIESSGGLEENSSALAEGMGQFADAQDARWSAVVIPSQPDSWVVVLEGTVTREGMTESDARSWVVHPEDDRGQVVESFASSVPEVVSPAQGTRELAPDTPVDVYLAAGDGSGTVLLDGEPLAEGVEVATADDDQLRVTALPPGGWPTGEHTVTVAGVPADAGAEGPWVSIAVPIVVP